MEVNFYYEKEREKIKKKLLNSIRMFLLSSDGHLKMHRICRLCLCIIC